MKGEQPSVLYARLTKSIYAGGIIKRWVGFGVGMLIPGLIIIVVEVTLGLFETPLPEASPACPNPRFEPWVGALSHNACSLEADFLLTVRSLDGI